MKGKVRLYVYLGRLSPVHVGQQRIIESCIESAGDLNNFLLIIGSSNEPISYRHLFTLQDRVRFICTLYPHINFGGLGDQLEHAYVGEWNGCTADANFHYLAETSFETEEVLHIPTWRMVHDALYILRRRT